MSCPYLKEVRMVFCRAYPVKKLVPLDQLVSASSCETACAFQDCPAYRDARALVVQAAEEAELVERLTTPAGAGVTAHGPTPVNGPAERPGSTPAAPAGATKGRTP